MKALLLNGCEKQEGTTDNLYNDIMEYLRNDGWETEPIFLKDVEITACQGCFDCLERK